MEFRGRIVTVGKSGVGGLSKQHTVLCLHVPLILLHMVAHRVTGLMLWLMRIFPPMGNVIEQPFLRPQLNRILQTDILCMCVAGDTGLDHLTLFLVNTHTKLIFIR